ncbi:hypothetical protein BDY17DRAFT_70250 [Neohortaea acidophila]|uniref:Uncharacterized protein n=1 Tax=Neohortaea acidophila TaxID=245834 RepID=A0A6A6Q269_9PEZI|nr:uncharacterized protein BDY17DRAFT_70250 [Neohortaea acidophila]KAF2486056.1 hypothetical protein BDY17DRAFT_70250 [Neohortaea acidophila]
MMQFCTAARVSLFISWACSCPSRPGRLGSPLLLPSVTSASEQCSGQGSRSTRFVLVCHNPASLSLSPSPASTFLARVPEGLGEEARVQHPTQASRVVAAHSLVLPLGLIGHMLAAPSAAYFQPFHRISSALHFVCADRNDKETRKPSDKSDGALDQDGDWPVSCQRSPHSSVTPAEANNQPRNLDTDTSSIQTTQ